MQQALFRFLVALTTDASLNSPIFAVADVLLLLQLTLKEQDRFILDALLTYHNNKDRSQLLTKLTQRLHDIKAMLPSSPSAPTAAAAASSSSSAASSSCSSPSNRPQSGMARAYTFCFFVRLFMSFCLAFPLLNLSNSAPHPSASAVPRNRSASVASTDFGRTTPLDEEVAAVASPLRNVHEGLSVLFSLCSL